MMAGRSPAVVDVLCPSYVLAFWMQPSPYANCQLICNNVSQKTYTTSCGSACTKESLHTCLNSSGHHVSADLRLVSGPQWGTSTCPPCCERPRGHARGLLTHPADSCISSIWFRSVGCLAPDGCISIIWFRSVPGAWPPTDVYQVSGSGAY